MATILEVGNDRYRGWQGVDTCTRCGHGFATEVVVLKSQARQELSEIMQLHILHCEGEENE